MHRQGVELAISRLLVRGPNHCPLHHRGIQHSYSVVVRNHNADWNTNNHLIYTKTVLSPCVLCNFHKSAAPELPASLRKNIIRSIDRVRKKRVCSITGITPSNTGQFSKFFRCHNPPKICNKVIVKFINVSPHIKRVATLPCEITTGA